MEESSTTKNLAIDGFKTELVYLTYKMMYNSIRLEWHLDVRREPIKPRRVLCGLARQQAELLIRVIRFAVALAKSQDHRASCGVFAFGRPSDSRYVTGPAWADKSDYTALISPVSKRRPALIERLVKQMGHGETTHLYKRINPSSALGVLCLFISIKSLEMVNRLTSIHPWRNYA